MGHCEQSSFGHPPKHRGMPFESALHTTFLPSQQFWDAFSPSAPQMLPGGLQAWPLSQRLSPSVQTTPAPGRLQQASVESQ